jgi:hypothetical protein
MKLKKNNKKVKQIAIKKIKIKIDCNTNLRTKLIFERADMNFKAERERKKKNKGLSELNCLFTMNMCSTTVKRKTYYF